MSITSCTDLEEKYGGNLTESQVANDEASIDALLTNLDNSLMAAFQIPFGGVITLSHVTTDELIVPTRGTDWYDNGQWQQLHQHRWNGDHGMIIGGFNDLS